MQKLMAIALVCLFLAACSNKPNAGYCADGDQDPLCNPGPACTEDLTCSGVPNKMVCDTADTGTCVQCTPEKKNACTDNQPICSTESLSCVACKMDIECGQGNACLPNGACTSAAEVAYVKVPGGAGTMCSKTEPCATLDEGLKRNRDFIVVSGAVTDNKETPANNKNVTILGEGDASIARSTAGTVLKIEGTSDIKIQGLTFKNSDGNAIEITNGYPRVALTSCTIDNNTGLGVNVISGNLTISRSVISRNGNGGVSVINNNLSRFNISNTVIVYNGDGEGGGTSTVGGLALTANNNDSSLTWNTIAFNQSDGNTFRGGASCNAPMAKSTGNVFFHNSESSGSGLKTDMTTQTNPAGNGCAASSNQITAVDDANNLGFTSVNLPYDFSLKSSSPLIDGAGTMCPMTDFSGLPRPAGAACDFGAYEYRQAP